MAVDANSYGASTGVERRVGDIVTSRAFSSTTVPTLGQVELAIDDIAAEMNTMLQGVGYTTPVSTGEVFARRWLQALNEDGAAAAILATMPQVAITITPEDASNRMAYYQRRYEEGLQRIEEGKLRVGRAQGKLHGLTAGAATSSDGATKLPLFRRGMDDAPGTRELTES